MRSDYEQTDSTTRSEYRELQMLSELESNSEVTQREISQRLGIALGLTNLLIRNLAQKGYIRATNTSWKRWLYALTPAGFSRKVSLTLLYITRVLNDYQRIKSMLITELESMTLHTESRVAICGTGEFAEIVYLGLKHIGVEEIDIFESELKLEKMFLGISVQDVKYLDLQNYDRVLIASLDNKNTVDGGSNIYGLVSDQVVTVFGQGKLGG